MGCQVFVKGWSFLREEEYREGTHSTRLPWHSHRFSHIDAEVKQSASHTEDKDLQPGISNRQKQTWSLQKSKAIWEVPYKCLYLLAAKSPYGCICLRINSSISSNGSQLLPALQNFSLYCYAAKMSGIMLFHNFKGAKSVLGQDLQVQSRQKWRPSNSAAAVLFWGSAGPCLENRSTAVSQLRYRGSPNQGMNVILTVQSHTD